MFSLAFQYTAQKARENAENLFDFKNFIAAQMEKESKIDELTQNLQHKPNGRVQSFIAGHCGQKI